MLPQSVVVVGAGPVGCLAALGMAQRGCSVDIYESRKDPQQEETSNQVQRSINLAISTRGITGLRSVSIKRNDFNSKSKDRVVEEEKVGLSQQEETEDLADLVLKDGVAMHARMIHYPNSSKDGNGINVKLDSQEYSINHEVSSLQMCWGWQEVVEIREGRTLSGSTDPFPFGAVMRLFMLYTPKSIIIESSLLRMGEKRALRL